MLDTDIGPIGRYILAQWLPLHPNGVSRSSLSRIASTDEHYREDHREYSRIAAVCVALKNPCIGSTRYLKEIASQDASSLLAMSLQQPRKFRAFIKQASLAKPAEPAAIMALLVSEGPKVATEMFALTLDKIPGQNERVCRIRDLFTAYQDLDFAAVATMLDPIGSTDILATFPYILMRLWDWTQVEKPNIGAISKLTSNAGDMKKIFDAYNIDSCGLAVRLAYLLGRAGPEEQLTIRESLLTVMDCIRWPPNGFAFLLDQLSGYEVFASTPSGNHKPVSMEGVLDCGASWQLLFDEAGNTRPILNHVAWDDVDGCIFPPDPIRAGRLATLLVGLGRWKDPVKELRPQTEIQKRLLLRRANIDTETKDS